ncbi:MAG: caspase family protein [Byssovorax sp.]
MQSEMLNNYALIIGVEDYSAYDKSVDQASGTSDLPGARNDARAMFQQCVAMGLSPERIRVLTSPPLAAADLGQGADRATLGEATQAAIVDGISWIARVVDCEGKASGLVSFSGHGVQDHGLALCPADTTSSLDEVIRVAEVFRRIGARAASENLTWVLDCCHAEVGRVIGMPLRARLQTLVANDAAGPADERVLAACERDQVSIYSLFSGVRMGAFTWALTSAMSQWRTAVAQDCVAHLTVSHGELLKRTRALLASLSYPQEPVFTGPPCLDQLALLQAGVEVHEGWTTSEPNQVRSKAQLQPDTYELSYYNGSSTVVLAYVSVTTTTETWTVSQTAAASLSTAQSMTLKTVSRVGTVTSPITETDATQVNWGSPLTNPRYPTAGTTFSSPSYRWQSSSGFYYTSALSINVQTATTRSGAAISSLTFFNPDNVNIDLSLNGGILTMSVATGNYPGTCYEVTTPLSYST